MIIKSGIIIFLISFQIYAKIPKFNWDAINNYSDKLSEEEIKNLDLFLSALEPKLKQRKIKAPQSYAIGNHVIDNNNYVVPREIKIIDPDKFAVILKDIIYAVNNQAKIVGAYDPREGKHLVKREAAEREFVLYQILSKNNFEGVIKIFALFKENNRNIVLLKRYKNNLFSILSDIKLKNQKSYSDEEKIQIIRHLLKGLENLHKLKLSTHDLKNRVIQVPFSHRDIKEQNIFCEDLTCDIGDFDLAMFIRNISGSKGYFSPETLQFAYEKSYRGLRDSLDFNRTFGQKTDIWALGLVIASLLISQPEAEIMIQAIKATTSNLNLNNNLQKFLGQKSFNQSNLLELQKNIDALQKENTNPNIIKIWNLVKRMLHPDPIQRPSAKQALEDL